jgi:hypothetical protein
MSAQDEEKIAAGRRAWSQIRKVATIDSWLTIGSALLVARRSSLVACALNTPGRRERSAENLTTPFTAGWLQTVLTVSPKRRAVPQRILPNVSRRSGIG